MGRNPDGVYIPNKKEMLSASNKMTDEQREGSEYREINSNEPKVYLDSREVHTAYGVVQYKTTRDTGIRLKDGKPVLFEYYQRKDNIPEYIVDYDITKEAAVEKLDDKEKELKKKIESLRSDLDRIYLLRDSLQ